MMENPSSSSAVSPRDVESPDALRPSSPFDSPWAPNDNDPDNDEDAGTPAAGPSRLGIKPTAAIPREEQRTTAKGGAIVLGSGDGLDCCEECFTWSDLVMNKTGALPPLHQ